MLVVYGTLALVAVPFHHHDDEMFASGRGEQTIAQHADALHCKHRAIETHSDCTICSFASHTVTTSVVAVVPQFKPKSTEHITACFFAVILHASSSHSHRGPPAFFA